MELELPPIAPGCRWSLGVDVGRIHDVTALVWICESPEGYYRVERVRCEHQLPFEQQEKLVSDAIEEGGIKNCEIDATGIGMPLAEKIHTKYPGIAKGITFTNQQKSEMVNNVLAQLEQHRMKLLPDGDLLSDITGIRRHLMPGGGVKYTAQRNEKGHADTFWAMALAMHGLTGTMWNIAIYDDKTFTTVGSGGTTESESLSEDEMRKAWKLPGAAELGIQSVAMDEFADELRDMGLQEDEIRRMIGPGYHPPRA
jgi:phage FluMu gp28-like protein